MLTKTPYTLLYIEDESSTQMVMTMMLESYFSEIYEASDGVEGLELYYSKKPDIILTDIEMPNMNGLEFCEEIRKEDKETPIIVLTAHMTVEFLLQAIHLNLLKYLGKPLQEEELEEALSICFNQLESRDSNIIRLGESIYYDKFNQSLSVEEKKVVQLTKSQRLLLDILIKNKNRIVTYEEIEYHISPDKPMSSDSLRTLVRRVRKIIGKDIIETVSKTGYKIRVYG